jgi:transposase
MLRIALDDTQRNELKQYARQAVGRESERAHFVLQADQGLTPREIAQWMDYTINTVKQWLRRYEQQGIAGLADEPCSGRPVKEQHLRDVLEAQMSQSPTGYGYLPTLWSIGLLVLHLTQRFKMKVSASSVRRALHAMRFSEGLIKSV